MTVPHSYTANRRMQLANDLYNAERVTLVFKDHADHGKDWERPVKLSYEDLDIIIAALRECSSATPSKSATDAFNGDTV
jgi:hypothetical protein